MDDEELETRNPNGQAYSDGWLAYLQGRQENSNPYPNSSIQFMSWKAGFNEAAYTNEQFTTPS